MKLGLLSDVHGDPAALTLALNHLDALGADKVVCAGDLVDYGPDADGAVALVVERGIPTVRGNHDRWALQRGAGQPDPFGGSPTSAASLDVLKTLPFHLEVEGDGRVVVLVHGSITEDMEFVTRRNHPPTLLREWLRTTGADVIVVGHTHEPMYCRAGAGVVINPGSVLSNISTNLRTSRTFALLDLPTLAVTHHDVATGAPVEVEPWSSDDARG